jgi:hypothetical protein
MICTFFRYVCNVARRVVVSILALFGVRFASGSITLVIDGQKTVNIDLPFTPREVWLDLKDPVGVPVCQGQLDSFDKRIVPNGFVLLVNLSSEYREVEWLAVK